MICLLVFVPKRGEIWETRFSPSIQIDLRTEEKYFLWEMRTRLCGCLLILLAFENN